MSVTVDDFSTWSFKVPETFLVYKKGERGMNSTGSSRCMRISNDSQYLLQDKSINIQRLTQPRKNDVSFVQMCYLDSASEMNYYRIIAVKILQTIHIDEELYIDYDSENSFS